MIECKNCRLPVLPPVLFWEGILNTRLACLCGCLERVESRSRVSAPGHIIDEDWYAQEKYEQDRATNEGMAVRSVAAVRSQLVAKPCPEKWAAERAEMRVQIRAELLTEMRAEMRASDEGMLDKDFVAPSAPMQAWKDFVFEEMRQAQDFSQWLVISNKKLPVAANKEGVVVEDVFQPLRLKKAFRSQSQKSVRRINSVEPDSYNPYMSGMETLSKIF